MLTVTELSALLQKAISEGKGDYQVRSSEFEYHDITEDHFHLDDENKTFWYEA